MIIYTISKTLGHKDLRVSARYSHLSAQYLSDALKGLNKVFEDKKAVSEVPSPRASPPPLPFLKQRP
jgi:hypothetical protein